MNQEKIQVASLLINLVYESEHGGAGGFGHIVFDDGNIDDGSIDFCLMYCAENVNGPRLSEECRLLSVVALEFFKTLSMEERQEVYENYHQY